MVASAGVSVRGPWSLAIALNFGLRCGSRVLCEVLRADVRTLDDVYSAVEKLNWPKFFKLEKTFAVNGTSTDNLIKAPSLNLKIKDAIVDSFKRQTRERPSVDKEDPQVRVMARLHRGVLSVSLDTTGLPLAMRGYRTSSHDAPLSEILAAGLLRMTGWAKLCRALREEDTKKVSFARVSEKSQATKTETPEKGRRIPGEVPLAPRLIDPMCGTGTFAIEAALQLLNRRPQLDRKFFAYESLEIIPSLSKKQVEFYRRTLREQELSLLDAFQKISHYKKEALGKNQPSAITSPPLLCSDQSVTALRAARANAEKAGVSKLIRFDQQDVLEMEVDAAEGLIVMNPPYGVRLGDEEDLKQLYKSIGDTLKKNCRGWQAWILAGSDGLAGSVGLRATRRRKVFNGGIECVWLQYVLF